MVAIAPGRVTSDEEDSQARVVVVYEIIHRRDLEKYPRRFD